jgi:hypothetical protein
MSESMPGVDCGCGCGGGSAGGGGSAAGCCQGIDVATPVPVNNPPGQPAIAYRGSRYGSLLSSMRARLSSPGYPALAGLTVRDLDDPAIALLDGWAVIGDVLTFYTERIANEGYLRTATEDTSLRLLGRLVGYAPRPGVAAGTYLAYTVDRDPNGRDTLVTIPRGSRAQSIPAPGQQPQAYETSEDLPARWSFNDLRVVRRRPIQLLQSDLATRTTLPLAGTATNLKPGDRLLFVFGAEPGLQVLTTAARVSIDQTASVTVVGLGVPSVPSMADLSAEYVAQVNWALADPMYTQSHIVKRFVDQILVPLRDRLDQVRDAFALASELSSVLDRLDEAAALGQPYENVRTWFVGRRSQLGSLRDRAAALQPAPGPDSPSLFAALGLDRLTAAQGSDGGGSDGAGSGGGSDGGSVPSTVDVDPALRGLAAALGALRRPPSRPPASGRDLVRDPAQLYGSGSDVRAQLLAALEPRLRDAIYDAWPQIDVTAPLALAGVQALRVVANPFGATAPLQPVFDAQGRVIRQEEWPLLGSQQLNLDVTYANDMPAAGVFSSVDQNVPSEHMRVGLAQDSTFNLGPWHVQIKVVPVPPPPPAQPSADQPPAEAPQPAEPPPAEPPPSEPPPSEPPGVTVTFQQGDQTPERVVFAQVDSADNTIQVSFRNGTDLPFVLAPGQGLDGTHEGWRVSADRGASTGSGSTIVVNLSRDVAPIAHNVLSLDAVYEGIAPGSSVVVDRPRKGKPANQGGIPGDESLSRVATRVIEVRTVALAAFGTSGKVTQLILATDWLDAFDTLLSDIRDASVYARGEPLALATEPETSDVAGDQIELADLHQGLRSGQWVVVAGSRTDVPGIGSGAGIPAAEVSMVSAVRQFVDASRPGDTTHTILTLAVPLAYRYRRESVHVYANVAPATQGASREEPIGSGDASRAGQTFTLFQAPLTWLAADTPLGAANTLEVRVDGVLWHEVDSFAGRGPNDRVYVTSTGEDGRTRVTFGDGVHGARLTTGVENVRARYRVGVGADANVAENRITQLAVRPLGVSAVNNPVPATGGANADDASQVRRGIPLAASALDRLVGISDYADFARVRAGIGRAAARRVFDEAREVVHVTIAGTDDVPLTDDSGIVTSLRASLRTFGDPALPVTVAVRELVLLLISASIAVAPDYTFSLVEPRVRAALLDRLGFAARELGQPAYLSEVVATAQRVPGVDHVHVDIFAGVPGSVTPQGLETLLGALGTPHSVVPARLATFEVTRFVTERDLPPQTLTEIAAKNGLTVAELLALNPGVVDTQPIPPGTSLVVFRGVRPAELVTLSGVVPDTLILKEARE